MIENLIIIPPNLKIKNKTITNAACLAIPNSR